ncbi:MAG: YihY/virulence factor BrkB family protein [Gemmatimonadota bacterium]|nr:YihY/virulence factor BrkB family protein [Gemmatimonadota bacterium]
MPLPDTPTALANKDVAPITDSPAAEQKAESVEKAQEAAVEMAWPGPMSTLRGFGSLVWGTILAFFSDDCSSMAAALSFYTFFSLPALMTLLLTIVGRVADPESTQKAIVGEVGGLIGSGGADQVAVIIGNAHLANSTATITTLLSLLVLGFGATTSFAQLQSALNKVWGVKPDPRRNQFHVFLMKRVFSFGVVITFAFLLLVSLAVNTTLVAIGERLSNGDAPTTVFQVLTTLVGFGIITGLFAVMYRYLPDARIAWRDVRAGALMSATLFTLGRTIIGIYLGRSNPGSVYGVAGSLAIVLIWVYYTSMIVLLGAEFTRLWAQRFGRGITPEKGAVAYVEEERQVRTGDSGPLTADAEKLPADVLGA